MSALRSMTGFAVTEGVLEGGARFVLAMKGVNHRFLDIHFRLPHGCDGLEMELRTLLKARLGRGHVDVTLEVSGAPSESGATINIEAFCAVAEELQAAARLAGLEERVDAATLLRVPGVLLTEGRSGRGVPGDLQEAVLATAGDVLTAFVASREREGAALGQELRDSMGRMEGLLDRVQVLRGGVRQALFDRLRARLTELLEGAVSEERLLTEAALMADKSDVEEEAVRLRTHLARFRELLEQGGLVGKQMDFLLQEFNREANTTLSKSGSAAGVDGIELVGLGLEMKSEIERAREQVQNLE